MLRLLTPWTPLPASDPDVAAMQDEEKDRTFRLLVANLLEQVVPAELLHALHDADVDLVALPHHFFVILKDEPLTWHEVPELSALLPFTPWREAGEIQH